MGGSRTASASVWVWGNLRKDLEATRSTAAQAHLLAKLNAGEASLRKGSSTGTSSLPALTGGGSQLSIGSQGTEVRVSL